MATTIKTAEENPSGLHQRYIVTKANGEPVDPRAVYFVLRLDSYGDDPVHIEACRDAADAYRQRVYLTDHASHLVKMAGELMEMVRQLEEVPLSK